ncbi:hypothetical protein GWI33_005143 [Rhynchophorus ferrugineus]|uniref:Uncharacterized protein n=1 Tax=Rhynchophorus ferrugineus TaxID=354439 RepID=A0A834MI81_RHYFE|nr:hypothetical protein GWI33_005143 [Rhynchophorus ferrugineus]
MIPVRAPRYANTDPSAAIVETHTQLFIQCKLGHCTKHHFEHQWCTERILIEKPVKNLISDLQRSTSAITQEHHQLGRKPVPELFQEPEYRYEASIHPRQHPKYSMGDISKA